MDNSLKSANPATSDQAQLFDLPPAEVCRVFGSKSFITPAQVLEIFNADFLDYEACRCWILEQIHIEGPACPYFDAVVDEVGRLRIFWSGRRLVCEYCGRFFKASSKTFLAGGHLDFAKFSLRCCWRRIKITGRWPGLNEFIHTQKHPDLESVQAVFIAFLPII